MTSLREDLVAKLKTLTEVLWLGAVDWPSIRRWLDNFADDSAGSRSERLHALFLLSQFMYFGSRELRELLRALFRDLYRYPIVEALRRDSRDSLDCVAINRQLAVELDRTRFLGMGNPSESGTHLLYTFRQENRLTRELFINSHEIFDRVGTPAGPTLREPAVSRYVFIDDFCGSGVQATEYSRTILADIKRINPQVRVLYYSLFATATGLAAARTGTLFDEVDTVFELDDTFQCFGAATRYFRLSHAELDRTFAEEMCRSHGLALWSRWPLGYRDGQLLIGFFHNVPDNTLPVIWNHGTDAVPWSPVFRRYPKLNSWGGA